MPVERRNEIVRIADMVVLADVLEDLHFENCEVVGPAVLAVLEGVTFEGCAFEAPGPDALIWTVEDDRIVMGAVGLRNVTFSNCRIRRIGLAVSQSQVNAVLDMLGRP